MNNKLKIIALLIWILVSSTAATFAMRYYFTNYDQAVFSNRIVFGLAFLVWVGLTVSPLVIMDRAQWRKNSYNSSERME